MKKSVDQKPKTKLEVVRTTIRPLAADSLKAAVGGLAHIQPRGCGYTDGGS